MNTFKTICLCASTVLFFKSNAQIYVSDAGNFETGPWAIFQFDEDGKNGKKFITENLNWPQDILFLENEKAVLVSNLNTGTIDKYSIESGTFISTFASGINGPTRMKIGPDEKLYVLQWQGNGKVKRYELDGTFLGDFTKTGVTTSIGLDWDKLGNLYVSSYNGKFVQKFNEKGESQGKFISTILTGPTNIIFDENDQLIVLDYSGGKVLKFDQNGKLLKELVSNVNQCEGVSIFENGNFLLGVGSTSSVNAYDGNGNFIKTIVPSGSQGLLTPNAVVVRKKISSLQNEPTLDQNFMSSIDHKKFIILSEVEGRKITSIDIFSINGKLHKTIQVPNEITWTAENLLSGLYIFIAHTADHKSYKQKIYIKN